MLSLLANKKKKENERNREKKKKINRRTIIIMHETREVSRMYAAKVRCLKIKQFIRWTIIIFSAFFFRFSFFFFGGIFRMEICRFSRADINDWLPVPYLPKKNVKQAWKIKLYCRSWKTKWESFFLQISFFHDSTT